MSPTDRPQTDHTVSNETGDDLSTTDSNAYIDMIVPSALDGERVDRAISMLGGCSRAQAAVLVDEGTATVNASVVAKVSLRLSEGDRLMVGHGPQEQVTEILAEPSVPFEVVFEDEYLAIIDKPAGLVVHPGAGNREGTLVNGLVHRYPGIRGVGEQTRPGIVHRLDSGTSGLMVVAKDAEAYDGLVEQLATRQVQRTYTALVNGHPKHARGVIDAPIGRSRQEPLRMTVALDGRQARTHYEVDSSFDEPVTASLLTCRLETGRTHQIRVHLSSIGHPVVGDDKYGGAKGRLSLDRPFLHARELSFDHPVTGESVSATSELAEDLSALLGGLS